MATLTKHTLSHSNSGRGVAVTATAVANSNPIHTSATGVLETDFDEVWMYANNDSSATVDLSVIWGLSAVADLGDTKLGNADVMTFQVSANTRAVILNGRLLQNGCAAYAYVSSPGSDGVVIDGYVNRIVA
tara:strand:+ start:462 stop:854 length:393 start_codon:yes stop_codon:yes gene_type:complete